MKVFVVTCGYDYEDTYVLGVYSTEAKANQAIEHDKEATGGLDWYDINEWEIDKN
jgi:hypothetical protein